MASVWAPRMRDEDEDVAGADRLAGRFEPLLAAEPAGDGVGDAVGELHLRALLAEMIDRARPVLRLDLRRRLDHRPEDDAAGEVEPRGGVDGRAGLGGEAAMHLLRGEDRVDRLEHHRHRAEGEVELGVAPGEPGAAGAVAELAPHAREPRRHGALEGVDRLLLVADGEEGADACRSRPRRRRTPRPAPDHLPLARAGVLRLVDEDVVEPAVELVVDPARGVGAGEQRHGLDHEVLEVEGAARRLHPLVVGDGRVGEAEDGGGRVVALGGAEAFEHDARGGRARPPASRRGRASRSSPRW